jgi:P2 family phage major capsid protein
MRNDTRLAFSTYLARVAALNGVGSATVQFNVDPTVQQTLETKIQESSAFLSKINVMGVRDQEGEKLGLGVSGPIASRTDTANTDRQTRDISTLASRRYRCEKTNFDSHIDYAKLDAWAKFPDFQSRVRDLVVQRQALDRMMIGFHGNAVSPQTDLNSYPMLQDVNIGWLHHLRTDAPDRVMSGGPNNPSEVSVGLDRHQDYRNLDALVFDALQLLDPWHREDPNLRVFMGRDLMHDKFHSIINVEQKPTETLASDILMAQKMMGGLPAIMVPYFPPGALLITRFDNLSIYYQDGARRRRLEDNPKRDRIENYESSNDAYVIEELGAAALVENIVIVAP